MSEVVVLITASAEEEAVKIARALVEDRLAACVNIVKSIRSIYRWEGKIEDDQEVLMLAKTTQALFPTLEKRVKELHSYTVPEIIAVPIIHGSENYLAWLRDMTV